MNDYIIIAIIGAWLVVLIASISIHQYATRKKIKIEKVLTDSIDTLRKDAFIQHRDFDKTGKRRLSMNQTWWYTAHRWEMRPDVLNIRWEEPTNNIDQSYKNYQKTSTKARIAWCIANVCSIGLYRVLM